MGHREQRSSQAPHAGEAVGSALLWNLASQITTQLVSIGVFLLLARELSPAAFGVYALALIFVEAFATEARAALADVLLMRRDFSQTTLCSALFASAGAALVIWLTLAGLAPAIGNLLGEPQISRMLPWLALAILLAPAQAVYEAIALNSLAFQRLAKRNMLSSLCGAAAALTALGLHAGDWALVAQRVMLSATGLGLLVLMTSWRPTAEFDWRGGRGITRPFLKLWLAQMVNFASGRAVDLMVGLRLGAPALGVFRVVGRLVEVAEALVTRPMVSVGLPLLTRHPAGSRQQAEQYWEIVAVTSLLAAPTFSGLALVAPELVTVLLDERYSDAGPVLTLLALASLAAPLSYLRGVALTAAGQPGKAAFLASAELVLLLALVSLGTVVGLIAAAGAVLAATWALAALGAVVLSRTIGLPLRRLLGACAPAFLPCVTMALAIFLAEPLINSLPPLLRLLGMIAIGGGTYLAHLWLLHGPWVAERLSYIRGGSSAATAR